MSEKLRGRLRLAYELLLPLFERPVVISAKRAGEVWGVSIHVARKLLKGLVASGLLVKIKVGRYNYYTTPDIFRRYARKLYLYSELEGKRGL